jgi:YD repeat-containing protein
MNASGMWDTSVAVMDGLGHTVHTQLTTDPQGTDYVDTSYDGMGRPFTTSNPHRSSPLQTDGTTTYIYDALGRPTLLTHPDASTVQWLYNGNIATSIDEGGHSWQRTSDALGRLTNVVEPTGASTGYAYDAQDNLRTVNQLGLSGETARARSFVYDSLSRLTSSTNPETGTISYTAAHN